MHILRQYIRLTLLEAHAKSDEEDPTEDLLTEPDFPDSDDEQEEQSVVSNIAGYTLPLGASPIIVPHLSSAARSLDLVLAALNPKRKGGVDRYKIIE